LLYDLLATLMRPVAWWGRLRTEGLEAVPGRGPLLLVPNHDSQWDPVLVGLAVRPRRRLHFLARALEHAVGALRSGEAVCVFPEGGLSWGRPSGRGAGWDAWLRRAQARESCSAPWPGPPATHSFRGAHA
jgi:1-acyl-sn-glycerol-3-phosphate acyltransferase